MAYNIFERWPFTSFQNLNLDWLLKAMKEAVEKSTNAEETAENLKQFVNTYFDNLDVQEEINNKIDEMVASGEFLDTFDQLIPSIVSAWLQENITPTSPAVDASLNIAGAAADAKITGDKVDDLKSAIDYTETLGQQLTRVANDDGYYWRYINNAWQHTAVQFWHVETYEVESDRRYSVTGDVYHPYVPACIFVGENDTFLGSTEIFTDQTWQREQKTYDVVIPRGCSRIYVNKFYTDQRATVKPYMPSSETKTKADSAYASSLKYNNQACYIALDEHYFSVAETSTGLDITLPYRMYLFYESAKAATIKTLADNVSSVTYSVDNGKNLIFDLTDNTMKNWVWADIVAANKDDYLLMASVGNGEINGGLLKPYWNYQLAKNALNNQYLLPYYYDSYMPTKITEIENACAFAEGIAFPFITDIHLRVNAKQSGRLLKYLCEHTNAVPFVVSGGDIPYATDTEENVLADAEAWLEYMAQWGKSKTIQVHGNHDYMCNIEGGGSYRCTVGQLHYYISDNSVLLTRPVGVLYGYYDVPNQNVRIIVTDDYDTGYSGNTWSGAEGYSAEQMAFIKNAILETEKNVLVISHQTSDTTMSNYINDQSLQNLLIAAKNKTGDFAAWDGDVIMHLSGHSHKDESHVDNNLLSVATVCDAAYPEPSGYTRGWGTVTEQAFDMVCIDTARKTINMVRIGAGSNRQFSY